MLIYLVINYFTISNGKVSLIKNARDYKSTNIDNDSDKDAEEKVKFLTKYIFTKYDLTHVLAKFVKETGTKWVYLPKNEYFLIGIIKKYIIKKIKEEIKSDKKSKKSKKSKKQQIE